MTCQLYALCFDAGRPRDLAAFWAGVLGRRLSEDPRDGVAVLPADGYGFRLGFFPGDEPKPVSNRIHFDLTSTTPENMRETVDRALRLGARHIDGIWLDRLTLGATVESVSVSGSTLSPEVVPRYLRSLAADPALKGGQIDEFVIEKAPSRLMFRAGHQGLVIPEKPDEEKS